MAELEPGTAAIIMMGNKQLQATKVAIGLLAEVLAVSKASKEGSPPPYQARGMVRLCRCSQLLHLTPLAAPQSSLDCRAWRQCCWNAGQLAGGMLGLASCSSSGSLLSLLHHGLHVLCCLPQR